jgi:N-acetylmuramoyl-L-alanine amidase
MPPPFRQVNRAQFAEILRQFNFTRTVNAVHFHHTSSPRHRDFRGEESVVAMFRHHTQNRGFRDIAQHITIAPDGTIFLGRNWNLPPASSEAHNGTSRLGPFMFETVGNFNVGEDPFTDPQRKTVFTVIALVQKRFGLPPTALNFHREFKATDCPGTSLRKDAVIAEVTRLHAAPDPLADVPFADPLSPEALETDLSQDEAVSGGASDVGEALREMEEAERVGAGLGSDETLNEEDDHEDIPQDGARP